MLPPEQQAIIRKCQHPSGGVGEFSTADLEMSISRRFCNIVEQCASRTAVQDDDNVWTYRELNRKADLVAGAILSRQGDDRAPVGVLLRNSSALIAALLGTWKAGKIVALFDPSMPDTRILAMLNQAQIRLVIGDAEAISHLGESATGVGWIDAHELDGFGSQVNHPANADDFACIFFTSGSTGEPKTVVWSHRNLLQQTMIFTHAYGFSMHDRLALLSSGTGSAVTSALIALLNGAAALSYDVKAHGVHQLASWLIREKISVCLLGTSLFRSLCDALTGAEEFADLRLLRLRSDTVRAADIELYQRHFSDHTVLVNGLSSSETGILTLCYFDRQSPVPAHEVPVGYPVPDTTILLLDEAGDEVGCGRIGEIVVRSGNLSPGYWRRPELTEQKFKLAGEGGVKLCFTGDLGMRLADGAIVHKGRKDLRVKIRGYGVDVEEVEKTLRQCPGVRDAIVVARRSETSEPKLAAYVVPLGSITVGEWRGFLVQQLPDYMIPAQFLILDRLPLTSNGKVDRHALPEPATGRPEIGTAFVAPSSAIEQRIQQIWSEVLSVYPVGIDDNFLDLGGHSVAAMRLVSRVCKEFQLEIPLRMLFEAPTVAQMADVIDRHQTQRASAATLLRMLSEVETMSEEEAQKQLAGETRGSKRGGHE